MIRSWLLLAAAAPLLVSCGDPCGNEIAQTVRSPSGRFDAVVFNRNCGATTGFNTQISVVAAGTELPANGGNVFVATGTIPVSLKWQTDAKLLIGGVSGISAVKKEPKVSDVEISYAL